MPSNGLFFAIWGTVRKIEATGSFCNLFFRVCRNRHRVFGHVWATLSESRDGHCRFIFFGMTAASLFILRRQQIVRNSVTYRVPGHPFYTMLFVLSLRTLVLYASVTASPRNSANRAVHYAGRRTPGFIYYFYGD